MTVKIDGTNTVANPAFTGADTDTGLQVGTDELKLVTGGTARVTVNSSGRLSSEGTSAIVHKYTGASNPVLLGQYNSSGDASINNQANANLLFATNNTEAMRILSDGTIRLASGCPGIDFSQIQTNASGMTSETLDSYEEGTWTPSIHGSTTAGTYTPHASGANGGYYVKVGRKVTVWMNALGTVANAAGDVRVNGLPFASAPSNTPSGTGNATYSTGSIQYWSGPAGLITAPLSLPGTTSLYFHKYDTAGSGSTAGSQPTITNVTHNLHAVVTYFTA